MSSADKRFCTRSFCSCETNEFDTCNLRNSRSERSFSGGSCDDEEVRGRDHYTSSRRSQAEDVVNKKSDVVNPVIVCGQENLRSSSSSRQSPREPCICRSRCHLEPTEVTSHTDTDRVAREISWVGKLREFFTWKRALALVSAQARSCGVYNPSNQTRPVGVEGCGDGHTQHVDTPGTNGGLAGVRLRGNSIDQRPADNDHISGNSKSSPTYNGDPSQLVSRSTSGNLCLSNPLDLYSRSWHEGSLHTCSVEGNHRHTTAITPTSTFPCTRHHTLCRWNENFTANALTYPIVSSSRGITRDSRWRRCGEGVHRACESPADRLVGLTLHCVILSLAVLVEKLTSWASRALEFCLYLALHSAVFKGKIMPLREDTSEPVSRQQLREATIFDSAGLKIILLQYLPPRRSALEFPSSSRIDSTCISSGSAATATTSIRKSTTTTTTSTSNSNITSPTSTTTNTSLTASNNMHSQKATATSQKSLSVHSDSSQDLSHIFSVSSS